MNPPLPWRLEARTRPAALIAVFLVFLASGCSDPSRKGDPATAPPPAPVEGDALSGVWRQTSGKGTRYYPGLQLQFKKSGFVTLGDAAKKDEWVANYRVEGTSLVFSDKHGNTLRYALGEQSDSEIFLGEHRLHYVGGLSVLQEAYTFLEGRWEHVSNREEVGPIADAKRQVQKIEAKIARLEGVLKSALADRDEYAAKLRSVGINSPADLKGNVRGRRLAESLVTLANEVEGLEQQLAVIDTELLKARSIVRRMEQEQAGLSSDEMRSLAQQLREAEDRTNGAPSPVTPLDVDAAVETALKGSVQPAAPKKTK